MFIITIASLCTNTVICVLSGSISADYYFSCFFACPVIFFFSCMPDSVNFTLLGGGDIYVPLIF